MGQPEPSRGEIRRRETRMLPALIWAFPGSWVGPLARPLWRPLARPSWRRSPRLVSCAALVAPTRAALVASSRAAPVAFPRAARVASSRAALVASSRAALEAVALCGLPTATNGPLPLYITEANLHRPPPPTNVPETKKEKKTMYGTIVRFFFFSDVTPIQKKKTMWRFCRAARWDGLFAGRFSLD